MTPGPLIIVSGPSGSGKSTLIRQVLREVAAEDPPASPRLRLAISATTRPARPGEVNGEQYHFWSRERFEEELKRGAFLEHAIVHGQHYYGTPRSEIDGYREQGIGVILDIDVQGAALVRPIYPDHLSVFVRLSDWKMYESRLRLRGSESEESIARRMQTAREELARIREYQYVIDNDHLASAVAEFRQLVARHVQQTTTLSNPLS